MTQEMVATTNPSPMLADYALELKEESKLYRRGKREQWDADSINWGQGTVLGTVQKAAGARVLSQFLYGEQASLLIAGQLLPLVTDMEARYFLASQAMDEARHAEVFYRYVTTLGKVYEPNENMRGLVEKLLSLPTADEKLVGMHILVEGLAQEVFHTAAQAIPDPLLKELLKPVLLDESRHVAFGTVYLKKVVARLDEAAKERIMSRQAEFGMLMAGLIADEADPSTEFGVDVEQVADRALRIHFRRLQEIGLMD